MLAEVQNQTATGHYSTHSFCSVQQAPFDTAAYSRMKFGSGTDARVLGYQMAEDFAAKHWSMLTGNPVVVIPAPTTSVAVAATLLGWHFHNRLNSLLDSAGYSPVQWDHVHRAVTYNDNYAQLSLAERQRLLADDERHVNVSFLRGKHLVFVDDVRITGTHEVKLMQMLQEVGLTQPVVFAAFASYTGTEPSVEHELNHAMVKNGLDVAALSNDPAWTVTTRSLRLLLGLAPEHFAMALRGMPYRRREEVYHASIAKGYSRHQPYEANFLALGQSIGRVGPTA